MDKLSSYYIFVLLNWLFFCIMYSVVPKKQWRNLKERINYSIASIGDIAMILYISLRIRVLLRFTKMKNKMYIRALVL